MTTISARKELVKILNVTGGIEDKFLATIDKKNIPEKMTMIYEQMRSKIFLTAIRT